MAKTTLDSLAVAGGEPAYAESLHVGRPNIPNREAFLARVNDILDRRWLTNNGHYVQELERRLCDRLGVKHCIPICNGTVALEIAIREAGISSGEIIVPSFTFIATAHCISWQGIKPVFCDIDPKTHILDPESVRKAITPQTRAILGVHTWGRPCAVPELTALAKERGLKLIFDAAHAFGCGFNGQMVGSFGDAEVFSFHATKVFNTLEGGAIATNNDAMAAAIRLTKNFGFQGYDNSIQIGTNGKMSEINAAMGITALEEFDDFVAANHRNYRAYRRALSGIPGLEVIEYDESLPQNYQYVVADIDRSVCALDRDAILDVLWKENILARRYFYPGCHRMPAYRTEDHLPHTDRVSDGVLVLPTGSTIQVEDVETICSIIRTAIENAQAVQRLRSAR